MAQKLQAAEAAKIATASIGSGEYVTVRVENQLFGIPVLQVQDVLQGLKVTRIPLAKKEVAGSLNLRGRIVIAYDVRERLGLHKIENRDMATVMSVVVEHGGEFFSLIVDSVGEVITLPLSQMEKNPANLSAYWKEVTSGIYKLDGELLVILDIKTLLNL
ncbi:MAG TPA: chemotaxis protein CheW [Rickettsiales bacterium]|nr:chemotaxis protein CheW [Rickettsiales bacterium]